MNLGRGLLEMLSAPCAEGFEVRDEGPAVGRDRVANAGRDGGLFEADQNAVGYEIFQVANQHSLGDSGNAATQFAGAHRLF